MHVHYTMPMIKMIYSIDVKERRTIIDFSPVSSKLSAKVDTLNKFNNN